MRLLTPLQRKVLKCLFADKLIRQHFYLTGGTALAAFYLEHRYSDDLDLFTHSIQLDSIERVITDHLHTAGFSFDSERSSSTFRRYRIEQELQLDLVRDVDYRVGSPQLIERIMVDTPKNIAVNKVLAVFGRLDPKDYVDLYFLLKSEDLDIMELFSLAQHKDAGLESFNWSRVIDDVETISILPRMVKELELSDLRKFFHKLKKDIVSSLRPSKR